MINSIVIGSFDIKDKSSAPSIDPEVLAKIDKCILIGNNLDNKVYTSNSIIIGDTSIVTSAQNPSLPSVYMERLIDLGWHSMLIGKIILHFVKAEITNLINSKIHMVGNIAALLDNPEFKNIFMEGSEGVYDMVERLEVDAKQIIDIKAIIHVMNSTITKLQNSNDIREMRHIIQSMESEIKDVGKSVIRCMDGALDFVAGEWATRLRGVYKIFAGLTDMVSSIVDRGAITDIRAIMSDVETGFGQLATLRSQINDMTSQLNALEGVSSMRTFNVLGRVARATFHSNIMSRQQQSWGIRLATYALQAVNAYYAMEAQEVNGHGDGQGLAGPEIPIPDSRLARRLRLNSVARSKLLLENYPGTALPGTTGTGL
jgi:hypothetical protein